MENIYTAYTKVIDGKVYYFVKKFSHFSEVKNTPDILESFGMHADFDRACDIAKIKDESVRLKLWNTVSTPADTKVIEMAERPRHAKAWFPNLHSLRWLPIAK